MIRIDESITKGKIDSIHVDPPHIPIDCVDHLVDNAGCLRLLQLTVEDVLLL